MHSYAPDVTETTCVAILQPGYRFGERHHPPRGVAVAEPQPGAQAVKSEDATAEAADDKEERWPGRRADVERLRRGGTSRMSTKDFIEKDYYKVLGVPKTPPRPRSRRRYRKLAREFHPDANKGNAKAGRTGFKGDLPRRTTSSGTPRSARSTTRHAPSSATALPSGPRRRGRRQLQLRTWATSSEADPRGGGAQGGGFGGGIGDVFAGCSTAALASRGKAVGEGEPAAGAPATWPVRTHVGHTRGMPFASPVPEQALQGACEVIRSGTRAVHRLGEAERHLGVRCPGRAGAAYGYRWSRRRG